MDDSLHSERITYRNELFFRNENIFGRHLLPKNMLLECCSTAKMFLHRNIFSHKYLERESVQTRGANGGTRWEGELKSAAVNNYAHINVSPHPPPSRGRWGKAGDLT